MSARIVAYGPRVQTVFKYLSYTPLPKHRSHLITETVFRTYEAAGDRALAGCFGIEDEVLYRRDVDPKRADPAVLGEYFDRVEVEAFEAFRDAGFRFYFVIEGDEYEPESVGSIA